MSEQALATRPEPAEFGTIERVIATGDLGKMSPDDRARYYLEVCRSLKLNPLTQPFQYIVLNSKLTLYATRAATDQLRALHRVSIEITGRDTVGDLYVVTARARLPDGRTDEEIGAVPIKGLGGDALANAYMKTLTKAKRRVTLAIVGLGWLDESELETIPNARTVAVEDAHAPVMVPGRSPRMAALIAEMDAAVAESDRDGWPGPAATESAFTETTGGSFTGPIKTAEAEPATVPGDDVDALTGDALADACERLRRRLNAAGLTPPSMPNRTAEKNLRAWWHHGAGMLSARAAPA